jgi:hypothetical protein
MIEPARYTRADRRPRGDGHRRGGGVFTQVEVSAQPWKIISSQIACVVFICGLGCGCSWRCWGKRNLPTIYCNSIGSGVGELHEHLDRFTVTAYEAIAGRQVLLDSLTPLFRHDSARDILHSPLISTRKVMRMLVSACHLACGEGRNFAYV